MATKENTNIIQISDLSIGDFVLDGTQIAQITGVTCDGVIETTANKNSNIELIEPILLTQRILFKNGFRYDTLSGFPKEMHLISLDDRIVINNYHLNSNNKWYVHIDTEDRRTLGTVELTYVHEFQNFLRLCGIKENIKP